MNDNYRKRRNAQVAIFVVGGAAAILFTLFGGESKGALVYMTLLFTVGSMVYIQALILDERISASDTRIVTLQKKVQGLSDLLPSNKDGSKTLDQKLDQTFEKVVQTNNRLAETSERFFSIKSTETVRIAIFDYLLLYLPAYIAEHLGYFQEEGISVHFVPLGNDLAVAKATQTGHVDFGICDPTVCVTANSDSAMALKVLMPLVQRPDIKPISHDSSSLQGRIQDPGSTKPVTIGTYEPPSTTYILAAALAHKIVCYREKIRAQEISVTTRSIDWDADVFRTPEMLREKLSEFDVAMLWQPYAEWATEIGTSSEFDFDGPPLIPLHATSTGIMISALVASQWQLRNRPELCRRVFRAFSRATMRLGMSDYLDVADEAVLKGVSNIHLDDNMRPKTISTMVDAGLYPVFDSMRSVLTNVTWAYQLMYAVELRSPFEKHLSDRLITADCTVLTKADHFWQFFFEEELI